MKKRELIRLIDMEDTRQGNFFENGQYRHGTRFYYGKLEKYPKAKLTKIFEQLKRTR